HPTGAPDEQPRRVNARLHVGQFERDRLIFNDGSTELLALLGVLERVLVGHSRDAERLGAHGWSRGFKGRHRGLARGALTFSNARPLLVQLLPAAQETATRYSTVFE